ncbi:MAG: Uma2 family endonuclease [Chloroflexota bacterium]
MRNRVSVTLAPAPTVWPPDDTERSVTGTSLHQASIRTLIGGINDAAAVTTPEGAPLVWQAGGQTMVRTFRRPDGTDYTILPDVFVYRHPWDDTRRSLNLTDDGPPVLIIEVLSQETYENDLDEVKGKRYSYQQAGVREYLTLDPEHQYTAVGGLGWRLEQGRYQPWQRDAEGRWVSREIPLPFGLEGARVAVYMVDGHRLLREGEVERALREKDRQRLQEFAQHEQLLRDRDRAQQHALAEQERLRQALAEQERLRREALTEQERLRHRLEELERRE